MLRWSFLLPVLFTFACATDAGTGPRDPDPTDPDPAEPGPEEPISVTRAFVDGPMMYLERSLGAEIVRLGLDTRWGGTIVELSVNGTDIVNAHDTGREIQAAFYDAAGQYDACAGCSGNWGWNPVQGGDIWNAGSPVAESRIEGSSLFVKTRPLEWFPDSKGGGQGHPIESDIIVEQWVAPVPDHFQAFRVHYRMTHLGDDDHGSASHEVPAVYANADYDRLAYYGGSTPWTRGAVTLGSLNQVGTDLGPSRYMAEYWAALVNAAGIGVTVYMPESMPYVNGFFAPGPGGPDGDATTYFAPSTPFEIGPHAVVELDFYVIAGHYASAREVVYALRPTVVIRDLLAPIGTLDAPQPGAQVSGTIDVAGWAFDLVGVIGVEIAVDGVFVANATYGVPRPDVALAYPGAPLGTGFEYRLDTTTLPDGPHVIQANARDAAGHAVRLEAPVEVRNDYFWKIPIPK